MNYLQVDDIHPLYIRWAFEYEPHTGELIWKNPRQGKIKGQIADKQGNTGYKHVNIFGHLSTGSHRVIWCYMTGEWPVVVDHINGIRCDNRWDNLRNVTETINSRNRAFPDGEKGKIRGVQFIPRSGKWRVNISSYYMGPFDNFFDACCCRKSAELVFGVSSTHGWSNHERSKISLKKKESYEPLRIPVDEEKLKNAIVEENYQAQEKFLNSYGCKTNKQIMEEQERNRKEKEEYWKLYERHKGLEKALSKLFYFRHELLEGIKKSNGRYSVESYANKTHIILYTNDYFQACCRRKSDELKGIKANKPPLNVLDGISFLMSDRGRKRFLVRYIGTYGRIENELYENYLDACCAIKKQELKNAA